jgi:hypothetical protein
VDVIQHPKPSASSEPHEAGHPSAAASRADGAVEQVDPTFLANATSFSRTTTLSYAYADVIPSLLWLAALLIYAPVLTVFLPGLITGVAAVLVDYTWMYRNGRREVKADGVVIGPMFIALWLIGWFEFLIAFNIGTYVGLMLHVGLRTQAGAIGTAAFLLWFWVLTPTLARLIADLGYGRALVTTTRRLGSNFSWGRLGMVFALHGVLYFRLLAPDLGHACELFALGMLAAGGMEVPLFMLGIRPGRDAWKALVLNTLVEWNYAVPIMYLLLHALGRLR